MKSKKIQSTALAIGAWLLAGSVHAASPLPLQGRDIHGAPVAADDPSAVFEYDPNLNLTWLRNWNYAAGSNTAWDAGMMTWTEAKSWASNLTVGGFGGWSLPTTLVPDATCSQNSWNPGVGYGCTGSPMGYLWHAELGNHYDPSDPTHPVSAGLFQNMQMSWYWSATEFRALGEGWAFSTVIGFQNIGATAPGGGTRQFAVAVRAGDVLTPVPEPMTWAMLLTGLGVLTLGRTRRANGAL